MRSEPGVIGHIEVGPRRIRGVRARSRRFVALEKLPMRVEWGEVQEQRLDLEAWRPASAPDED